jgi:hypothetical protein
VECPVERDEWEPLEVCVTTELCNAGSQRCDPPVCDTDPRQYRCEDNNYQECADDRTGWETKQVCGTGVCDLSVKGCSNVPCTEGEYRCNDIYLELCEAGSWERASRCATYALCDLEDRTCREPVCEEGEFQCVGGQSLQRCPPTRDEWQDVTTCSPDTECDADLGRCRPLNQES